MCAGDGDRDRNGEREGKVAGDGQSMIRIAYWQEDMGEGEGEVAVEQQAGCGWAGTEKEHIARARI